MTSPADPGRALTREERRAKREARRLRQRTENIERAAKMRAARLTWEREAVAPAPAAPKAAIHVGCSGWFYWHWRGCFYPADLPTRDWFKHYVARFKTVELNAPFYSWPTVAAVQSWTRQIGRRHFIYTVKASELITHGQALHWDGHVDARLRPHRQSSGVADGMPSFSTPAELSLHTLTLGSHPRPTQSRRAATSSSSDIAVGGGRRFSTPSASAARFSAPVALRGCRMNW